MYERWLYDCSFLIMGCAWCALCPYCNCVGCLWRGTAAFKMEYSIKNPNTHCRLNAGNSCWRGGDVKTSRNPCQLSKYLAILLCREVWIFSGITQWNGVLVNILVSVAGLSLKHSINFIISVSIGQGWKKLASTNWWYL